VIFIFPSMFVVALGPAALNLMKTFAGGWWRSVLIGRAQARSTRQWTTRPRHLKPGAPAKPASALEQLEALGGHLTPDNVRLGHTSCNNHDFTWRKGMCLGKSALGYPRRLPLG
jgi:hypothetical protein